jgi:hypothetical protein
VLGLRRRQILASRFEHEVLVILVESSVQLVTYDITMSSVLRSSSAAENIPLFRGGRIRANSDVGVYSLGHLKPRRFVSSALGHTLSEVGEH